MNIHKALIIAHGYICMFSNKYFSLRFKFTIVFKFVTTMTVNFKAKFSFHTYYFPQQQLK